MTTKSNNPKAPRDCKETQPSTKGVVAVSHRLKALSLMPLHALAEGRNQTIPSLLCDLTGLPKARISKGNLDAVRPSTKAKINLHLEELLQVQFKDDPEGLDELMPAQAALGETCHQSSASGTRCSNALETGLRPMCSNACSMQ